MQPTSTTPPSERARVAVVEDDETVRASVSFSLEQEGYVVLEYSDGMAAWEAWADAASAELPDLVVLDIMMPRMDGLELCRRLRGRSQSLPILFLTSRDEEFDRVLGLELGADDYLCKPFSMRELMARVKVLMRRLQLLRARGAGQSPVESPEDLLQVGALRLDTARHQASWNGTELRLTITEFLMVRALAQRPGHVRSRAQLIEEGYPHDAYVSDRTVDTHIKRLRRKFSDVDPQFEDLETVYGVGYRWRER